MALRALTDGKMPVKCVPGRLAMARLRPDAFPGGNPWQVLRSMHPESGLGRENRQFVARFARHASEHGLALARCARHASESPANRRWRLHRANILPGRGPFRCTGTANHARRADLAIRRRRTTLAPATSVPPNSASRPQSQHRPHAASALGTCHPAQRQTALAPATPAPPTRPRSAKAQLGGQPRRKQSRAPHQRQRSAL